MANEDYDALVIWGARRWYDSRRATWRRQLGRPGGNASLLPLAGEDRADPKLALGRMGLLAPAAAGR